MTGETPTNEVIRPAAAAGPAEAPFPVGLAERAQAFGETGYAVIDGGLFDDLPGALRRAGLFGRSLFLDHADAEIERAGPWLVPLSRAGDAPERIFRLVGDRPAVVIWSCAAGEPALYRHLRSLNLVRIPAWAAAGGSTPPEDGAEAPDETVMFRHWDPRVLGALMPVLDAGQFARIVGPASEVAYWAEDYGGLKRVIADPDWPVAGGGLLTVRAEQIALLGDRRVDASRQRIMSFLRDTAPEHASHRSDGELYQDVVRYEASAREVGLTSERSFGKWAHLMAMSGEAIAVKDGPAHRYLTTAPGRPDDKLETLIAEMIAVARHAERGA
ncbi:DUF4123 domain-containing protein [Methylobacterium platani]|uniref:DUF4123 domain-containing protein n=1 Tax=Methylobacterium platani TaxID=427683 RepID=A0A179SBY7_9HYPH|nr:DUF4123 domain-containing protein [Methylobacterium platani]OAS24295.1 hypothetical protein A5481_14650 [Methylobacterium platani]